MVMLLIDTSTDTSLLALANGESTLDPIEAISHQGMGRAHEIMPLLAELLNRHGYSNGKVDTLFVGVGPGSYTGIRVGVIIAKTLAFAHHIPLVPIPSLYTFPPPSTVNRFTVLLDAKIGGIYGVHGRQQGKEITYETMPCLWSLEETHAQLELFQPEAILTPDKKVPTRLKKEEERWHFVSPDPWRAMNYGWEAQKKGLARTDGEVEILYLRKTQAETELESP